MKAMKQTNQLVIQEAIQELEAKEESSIAPAPNMEIYMLMQRALVNVNKSGLPANNQVVIEEFTRLLIELCFAAVADIRTLSKINLAAIGELYEEYTEKFGRQEKYH